MSLLFNNGTTASADYVAGYEKLNGADMTWVMASTILVFIMVHLTFCGLSLNSTTNRHQLTASFTAVHNPSCFHMTILVGTVEFKNGLSVILMCMLTLSVVR